MSHLKILYVMLKDAADHVIILSGKGTSKSKRELLDRISSISPNESMILIAPGKYVGYSAMTRIRKLCHNLSISGNIDIFSL